MQAVGSETQTSGASIYGPEVVDRTRGSKWLSALPTGNADQEFSETLRKTEESGKSNLCFPDSCSIWRQQPSAGSACREQVGDAQPA